MPICKALSQHGCIWLLICITVAAIVADQVYAVQINNAGTSGPNVQVKAATKLRLHAELLLLILQKSSCIMMSAYPGCLGEHIRATNISSLSGPHMIQQHRGNRGTLHCICSSHLINQSF